MFSTMNVALCLGSAELEARLERALAGLPVRTLVGAGPDLSGVDVLVAWRFAARDFRNFENLSLLQVWGSGTDQVVLGDLPPHTTVRTTRGHQRRAVAEHVLAQVLAWERRLLERHAAVQAGAWSWGGRTTCRELGQLRACVLGAGAIGSAVGELLAQVGVAVTSVRAHTPREQLLRALAGADYVVLCFPLTAQNTRFFDAQLLSAMAPHAVLINVARGAVVDGAALHDHLQHGALRGASLDVFEHEPPTDDALLKCPNVLLSPHCAGATDRAADNAIATVAQHVGEHLRRFS
jgi:phosphoglycerate dehydrogenase-like enzyme